MKTAGKAELEGQNNVLKGETKTMDAKKDGRDGFFPSFFELLAGAEPTGVEPLVDKNGQLR